MREWYLPWLIIPRIIDEALVVLPVDARQDL
jgi:hypothetical protein